MSNDSIKLFNSDYVISSKHCLFHFVSDDSIHFVQHYIYDAYITPIRSQISTWRLLILFTNGLQAAHETISQLDGSCRLLAPSPQGNLGH